MKSPFSKNSDSNVEFAYFGKLPKFGDFVRFNASRPELKAFDEWLQDGLLFTKKTWRSIFDNKFDALSLGFLYPCEETKTVLVGGMKASTDKVGRHYPFYATLLQGAAAFTEDEDFVFSLLAERFLKYVFPFMNSVAEADESAQIEQEFETLERFVLSENGDETKSMAPFPDSEQELKQSQLTLDGSGVGYQLGIQAGRPEHISPVLRELSTGGIFPYLFWHAQVPEPALYVFGKLPSPKIWANIIDAEMDSEYIRKIAPDPSADFD